MNVTAKCATAAMNEGYSMFAVQHGGWCAASASAPQTFDKYGKSTFCGADGKGGVFANEVYVIKAYQTIDCYRDTQNRAIPTLEGTDSLLDGAYDTRKNAIAKCAVAAMRRGYRMFAVQHGGWCAASPTVHQNFDKYGKSALCRGDGKGAVFANEVYVFKDYQTVGCYRDTKERAIQSLERENPLMAGAYDSRKNAIGKCAVAAMRKGYRMFAAQDGGWCATSPISHQTFDKYGKSAVCRDDGKGGVFANEVYVFKGYHTLGCYRDAKELALQSLEGTDPVLDGTYDSRKNPIAKCAVAGMRKGYSMFAVQDGGWCAASATAPLTFDKYGKSTACKSDGEGGYFANQVYQFELNMTGVL